MGGGVTGLPHPEPPHPEETPPGGVSKGEGRGNPVAAAGRRHQFVTLRRRPSAASFAGSIHQVSGWTPDAGIAAGMPKRLQ